MGLPLDELVERVANAPYYPPLFDLAFGGEEITEQRISAALAQFSRAIVSYQSRWDEGVVLVDDASVDFPNFTAIENRGKDIFFGRHAPDVGGLCGTCHLPGNPIAAPPPGPGAPPADNLAIFVMPNPRNNGLPDQDDNGVGDVSGDPRDDGRFKSPTLRNIDLTGPYMHDGRFDTLAQVVEHYNSGIQAHPNLSPALRAGGPGGPGGNVQPLRLNLSQADKAALVAFMRTLTDTTLAQDERYADPFEQ